MKTILLVGGGHAHLEVISALSKEETQSNRYVLISPDENSFYSGLIPRLIMGEVSVNQMTIQTARYARSKGIEFVKGQAASVDLIERTVTLSDGRVFNFDLLSLNIGGAPKKIPSASSYNSVYLRPFAEFTEKWREVQRVCSKCQSPTFVVVGGGAAAVEISSALKVRLMRNFATKANVHIVTRGDRLCETYAPPISSSILRSSQNLGIQVHLSESVDQIFEKYVVLKDKSRLRFDYIFLATPNQPQKLLWEGQNPGTAETPLTDSKLQLAPGVFAIGDFASQIGHRDLPKSGVIAVHQGRYLARGLRAALAYEEIPPFTPPAHQLNILVTGDGIARAIWGNSSFEAKPVMALKNWIDDRYMKRFDEN